MAQQIRLSLRIRDTATDTGCGLRQSVGMWGVGVPGVAQHATQVHTGSAIAIHGALRRQLCAATATAADGWPCTTIGAAAAGASEAASPPDENGAAAGAGAGAVGGFAAEPPAAPKANGAELDAVLPAPPNENPPLAPPALAAATAPAPAPPSNENGVAEPAAVAATGADAEGCSRQHAPLCSRQSAAWHSLLQ